ncbi:MAG: DUF4129 domain-containing protein [Anaerolineae bacterium]|nr:DUF4129 domain-containing protein [Anaerolineae bacterium]
MMQNNKLSLVIMFGAGFFALILLGMGLNQLQLDPGLPFEDLWAFLVSEFFGENADNSSVAAVDLGIGTTIVNIVRTVYTIVLICFPLAVLLVISKKESRKCLLRTILFLFLLTIVLSKFVQNMQINEIEDILDTGQVVIPTEQATQIETSIEETFEPNIPGWLTWSISAIIILFIMAISFALYKFFFPGSVDASPLTGIADQAQQAVAAIHQGQNFENTIMQCYASMINIVREQRGLQRNSAVTASEFIASLVKLGIPEYAVTDLTRLFEDVRYGSIQHTPDKEQQATINLQTIADSFKATS